MRIKMRIKELKFKIVNQTDRINFSSQKRFKSFLFEQITSINFINFIFKAKIKRKV